MLADYPNRLTTPEPERQTYPRAIGRLTALVLVCLALRSAMALRVPGVSPDSVLYIQLAKSLDAGDIRGGTEDLSINTFPVILMLLHRLGLDWETAGVLWSLLVSSLVVLPLFGWLRRQFDDRVALVACLLYAVQPKMIAWSPEIMRDPTFWFLFALSIYLQWRAVTEVRLRWFVLGGMATSLACLTRFEGFRYSCRWRSGHSGDCGPWLPGDEGWSSARRRAWLCFRPWSSWRTWHGCRRPAVGSCPGWDRWHGSNRGCKGPRGAPCRRRWRRRPPRCRPPRKWRRRDLRHCRRRHPACRSLRLR